MKLFTIFTAVLAGALTTEALRVPSELIERREIAFNSKRDGLLSDLWKRKGGGGGGKGGSGSSSGSSSSGSSSSGSSSGSSSAGGRTGGTTSSGTVAPKTIGGGRYYGGGATTAYAAGGRTNSGLLPVGLLGVGALGFFGGAWLYGAYLYSYPRPYTFHNASSGQNETKPVDCLCQQYSACGCDNTTDTSYIDGLIGNGTSSALNQSLVRVADVNGTSTIAINGTLDNGTTTTAGAMSLNGRAAETIGWCVIGGVVALATWVL